MTNGEIYEFVREWYCEGREREPLDDEENEGDRIARDAKMNDGELVVWAGVICSHRVKQLEHFIRKRL
jgi:hypothetical protein